MATKLVRRVARGVRHDDWSALSANELTATGVQVFPNFVNENQASEVESASRQILSQYGASHLTPEESNVYKKQMAHLGKAVQEATPINMTRATGRPEKAHQETCPWGYGDAFSADQLPSAIRRLADTIQTQLHLGTLRDVTINQRRHGFFRLDPHLDPIDDGPNVCILGLCSHTVLTLTRLGPPLSNLADQRLVALESWNTSEDIDILSQRNSLIHLSGQARNTLNHAIRLGVSGSQFSTLGVSLPAPEAEHNETSKNSLPELYDWFGSLYSPIPRSHERISIVCAFDDR